MNVARLWQQLEKLESENRFSGAPYPEGLSPFPFRLSGQGFFPGGDGLWREDASASCPGELPVDGVLFLGSDFGTLQSYKKLCSRGYENVSTWRHLRWRILDAGLPTGKVFCSNVYFGLRTVGKALGVYPAVSTEGYPAFCAEFLRFQIEVLSPKLIVTLGPVPQVFVQRFRTTLFSNFPRPTLLFTPHPYGDCALPQKRRDEIAIELRAAWEKATFSSQPPMLCQ